MASSASKQSLELRDIEAFCVVAELLSLTQAGAVLGETKGTLSRRLTRLERRLGASLLHRTPKVVSLTTGGETFLRTARRAIRLIHEAQESVTRSEKANAGALRITASHDLALGVLAEPLASFARTYKNISLELILTDRLVNLSAERVDVAFRAAPSLADSTLVARKMLDVEGGLYATSRYLEAHSSPRRLSELAEHRMLISRSVRRGEATIQLTRKETSAQRLVKLVHAVTSTDFALSKRLCLLDAGIAVLPNLLAESEVAEGLLRRVLPRYAVFQASVYLVTANAKKMPQRVRLFRDFMGDALRDAGQSMNGRHSA